MKGRNFDSSERSRGRERRNVRPKTPEPRIRIEEGAWWWDIAKT